MANTFGKRKRDEDSVLDGDVMLSGPMYDSDGEVDDEEDAPRSFGASSGKPIISLDEGVTFETGISGDEDEDDDGDAPRKKTRGNSGDPTHAGRRSIHIEYIENKARRHITFSKRRAGIMKKAYELSVLTGTQILLLVVSETGLVYTYTTPKLEPLVTQAEGKNLIQSCLNAPDGEAPGGAPLGTGGMTTGARPKAKSRAANTEGVPIRHKDEYVAPALGTNAAGPSSSSSIPVSSGPTQHNLPKQSTPVKPQGKSGPTRKPSYRSSSPAPSGEFLNHPLPAHRDSQDNTPPITEQMLQVMERAKLAQAAAGERVAEFHPHLNLQPTPSEMGGSINPAYPPSQEYSKQQQQPQQAQPFHLAHSQGTPQLPNRQYPSSSVFLTHQQHQQLYDRHLQSSSDPYPGPPAQSPALHHHQPHPQPQYHHHLPPQPPPHPSYQQQPLTYHPNPSHPNPQTHHPSGRTQDTPSSLDERDPLSSELTGSFEYGIDDPDGLGIVGFRPDGGQPGSGQGPFGQREEGW